MAKKTFNVQSTLAVPTRTLSADDIERATQQIHQPTTIVPKNMVEKVVEKQPIVPKTAKKQAAIATSLQPPRRKNAQPAADDAPRRKVRLSVDVSPETHKKLKIRAIEHDSDLMRYVEWLIEKDLAKQ